jgi:proline-specific peptidase
MNRNEPRPAEPNIREGQISFRGFSTWYQVTGNSNSNNVPVILLHGGPGYPSTSLEPMEILAKNDRAVVRYDQIGCGKSSLKDIPHDSSMFVTDLFVQELKTLVSELGLEDYVLLGHSWGGMLALEFALTKPVGLRGLVLYSTLASIAEWFVASEKLVATLPESAQEAIRKSRLTNDTDSLEFKAAEHEFNRRFVCRLDPLPDCVQLAETALAADNEVYKVMVGGSEFDSGGAMTPLKDWDVRPRLKEISVPTLCISGEFDEATPEVMGTVANGISGSVWHVIPGASHSSHLETPEIFFPLVEKFLSELDEGERITR